MHVAKTIPRIRRLIKQAKTEGNTIGFVPTMGALHQGHASLLKKCHKENGLSVLSIFVNPAQFGPREDFKKYPRRQKEDFAIARQEKIDIIFAPTSAEMYPNNFLTSVDVNAITAVMCGARRPGHFKGVATVVAKLLNIIQPDVLYLGQKDGQQVVVLKAMIQELNFPVSVSVCPTIREKDGLAMSSRNVYLNPKDRRQAPILYQSLLLAKRQVLAGEKSPSTIITNIAKHISKNTNAIIDYISCVNADTLDSLKKLEGNVMIALAARFSRTHLIDNIIFRVK